LNDEFGALAAAKGLRLTVVPCRAVVSTDPAYLRRILQNLIGNAVRYTDRGRVLVGVRRRGGMVRLEVRDTGPGIPEAEQDNIFKEFHRLNARASASEGMGLGLAIVERACGLLGHPLGLVSEVGRGTCFMVQLPLAEPGSPTAPEGARLVETRLTMADRIVFLVENDAEVRRAIGLLLEKWGASVIEAPTGEAALDLIEELGILPDCLLVDHDLGPGMDGLAFVAAIRARHGDVPVRLVTAMRSPDLVARAAAAGVGILPKPIDSGALRGFLAGLPGQG
jgi:CheY-like chemotaxis protein